MVSLAKTAIGVVKAYSILRRFRPHVVIGTGGYTSAGVIIAAQLRGIKTLIHEQNVVPGRTNRLLARVADKICLTFEESKSYFPSGKTVLTGLPLRGEFLSPPNRVDARKELGLEPETFTLLVTGGSQGARTLNEMTLGALPMLLEAGLQILHQTGEKNFADIEAARPPEAESYHIRPYIHNMAVAYAAADLVIARSGAATIADLTAIGRPAILVPYPYAGGHQRKNAASITSRGAAIAVEESELSSEVLAALILDLKNDPERLAAMASASASLAKPDAAREIIEIAMEISRSD